ncbi:MAG: YihY/virulence factor BrkB family protein [Deltaproteobacteria bacterium]|nr:YihY/virulence factor BrkB family protein [Deltaproteobacteria bacterium]
MIARQLRRLWAFILALDDHDAASAASAMAFHAFFSLVPLLALAGWGAHWLLRTDANAFGPLFRFTPSAVTALADTQMMRLSAESSAVLPPLSILGFLWLCSGGLAQTMHQFERVFGGPPRSWLRRRGLALLFVLVALVIVAVAVLLGVALARLGALGNFAALWLVPFFGLWLLVGLFFRYATDRRGDASPSGFRGALVTLLCWAVLSAAVSSYVREIANYSQFFGGVAAIAVLLLWLWLMALALLVGGEVNARIEGRRAPLSRHFEKTLPS